VLKVCIVSEKPPGPFALFCTLGFFWSKLLGPGEQRLEELDRKKEELHKGMEDNILEFAKRMDASWTELKELLKRVK